MYRAFGIQAFNEPGTLAAALFQIGGKAAFVLMVPVLAGFIAFSIADRPGLAPGLIGGMLASLCGAGFLGGIVAGYSVRFLAQNIKLPASMEALKPVLVLPLLSTLITGLIMIYVVGGPVSAVMEGLTTFLGNMTSTNAILLGAMQGFDLGGPVNKAAYTFGVGLLASHSYTPMAAIMAAGMVPALGMGVATWAARAKFNAAEHEAGNASFILGLCFISEGAIPFAARDPMRVIPSTMVGGAIAGGLSMYFGCTLMAPHGGLFVLAIPHAVEHVMQYLLSIALGTIACGLMYALLKPSAVAQTV